MNRTSYEGEKFDGLAAIAWEPALLPILNKGTKEPMPTVAADKVLLSDDSEIFVCTVGDCRYYGGSTQAITISHRPRVHPEELKDWNKNKGTKQRFDLGEMAEMPLGQVLDLAQQANKKGDSKDSREDLVEKWRLRALNAEAENRAVQAALKTLGLKAAE